jgi:hypothetical protein
MGRRRREAKTLYAKYIYIIIEFIVFSLTWHPCLDLLVHWNSIIHFWGASLVCRVAYHLTQIDFICLKSLFNKNKNSRIFVKIIFHYLIILFEIHIIISWIMCYHHFLNNVLSLFVYTYICFMRNMYSEDFGLSVPHFFILFFL